MQSKIAPGKLRVLVQRRKDSGEKRTKEGLTGIMRPYTPFGKRPGHYSTLLIALNWEKKTFPQGYKQKNRGRFQE